MGAKEAGRSGKKAARPARGSKSAKRAGAAAESDEEGEDDDDDESGNDASASTDEEGDGSAGEDDDEEDEEDEADGDDDDDDDSSSDEEEDEAEAAEARAAAAEVTGAPQGTVLTVSAVEKMAQLAVAEGHTKAVRELVHALRAAAAAAEAGGVGGNGKGDADAESLKYSITTVAVYHRVLVAGLRRLPGLLLAAVTGAPAAAKAARGKRQRDEDGADAPAEAAAPVFSGSRFARHRTTIRAALGAVLRLLPNLRSRSLSVFALRCLRAWVPLFEPFPKHARSLLKALLSQWTTSEDPGVQLVAFLRLRQCALALPAAMGADRILKGLYAAGIFPAMTYRHAFVYIRQLAVHLRAALTSPTGSNRDKVLRWQFVSAVRLWCAVLRAHAAGPSADAAVNPLADLIFPLTQVALGVIRLAPGPAWQPLKLHILEALVELQWATGSFVPCAQPLIEVATFAVTGKGATGMLTSPPVRGALLDRALAVLNDWLRVHHTSPAFPEVAGPVMAQLRALAKLATSRRAGAVLAGGVGAGWKARIRAVIASAEARAAEVARQRSASSLKPTDTEGVASFMAAERKAAAAAFATAKKAEAAEVGRQAKRAAMEAAADGTAGEDAPVPFGIADGGMEEAELEGEADEVRDIDMDEF
ncbi:hypothetical protein FNF28_06999 [Cafeteria roenbergensis]|uniref:Nucleolar complex protein 2 homolog n=1 Tax=Cafeteria roenbergensis TaxID=33653 RepID=A0A5A8CIN7_CAFRO|nr:hypothetical protein FNF28_06999 [Cafeteria roenbergensis]